MPIFTGPDKLLLLSASLAEEGHVAVFVVLASDRSGPAHLVVVSHRGGALLLLLPSQLCLTEWVVLPACLASFLLPLPRRRPSVFSIFAYECLKNRLRYGTDFFLCWILSGAQTGFV